MTEAQKDTQRAHVAAKAIIDGRFPPDDASSIMVTLEHAVTTVLLALYGEPAKAAAILNEALVQGVEERLAFYDSKQHTK